MKELSMEELSEKLTDKEKLRLFKIQLKKVAGSTLKHFEGIARKLKALKIAFSVTLVIAMIEAIILIIIYRMRG